LGYFASPSIAAGYAPVMRRLAGPALPLALAATAMAAPPPLTPGLVLRIEPIRFCAFALWHPELTDLVPADAVLAWLLEPVLLARAVRLRDRVLYNFETGGAPLSAASLFDAAIQICGHAATALLLCLTVTRCFARGGEAVAWRPLDRQAGVFGDGVQRFAGPPDRPGGLFFRLFSPAAFGTADEGDWYRFFALAALAAFTGGQACAAPVALPEGPALALGRRVDTALSMMGEPPCASPAERAWRWANALSFCEWAGWGRRQDRAATAAKQAMAAVAFGLAQCGAAPDMAWRWLVPVAGAWRDAAGPGHAVAEVLTGQAAAVA
jgi:hypothetical protein